MACQHCEAGSAYVPNAGGEYKATLKVGPASPVLTTHWTAIEIYR